MTEKVKAFTVLFLAVGLMGLLGTITVGEFMEAMDNDHPLDPNVIELLQMSITGIVGIVAGYVAGKN